MPVSCSFQWVVHVSCAWISDFSCSLTLSDAFEHSIKHLKYSTMTIYSEVCLNGYLSCSSSVSDRLLDSCSIPAPQALQLRYMILDVARLFNCVCHIWTLIKLSWIFESKLDSSCWPVATTLFPEWLPKGTGSKLVSCSVVWAH